MTSPNASQTRNPSTSRQAVTPSGRIWRPSYSAEQWLFLRRLQGLFTKRRQQVDRLVPSDWRLRLIDKALYSTYRDCLDLDLLAEARELLDADAD